MCGWQQRQLESITIRTCVLLMPVSRQLKRICADTDRFTVSSGGGSGEAVAASTCCWS